MKLPKSVQVGPFRYTVSAGEPLDAADRVGEYRYEEQTIKLSDRCLPGQEPVVLLHEIMHAVNEVFKADLKERQVEVLAHGLAQALSSMGAWPEEFE